ncbi:hypothetical protein [Rhizobium sp. PP-F2F-G48]|uniref:hypothetical protein n=1 Tax=Rhizobium sp. PP-F2F-G48 TaxID=2135651 RepID=UPI001A9E7BDD|nr:hypothetical protein [Rhizobium sp. PP-F2F-G48]
MVPKEIELHWAGAVGGQLNLAAQKLSVSNRIVQSLELDQGPRINDPPELEVVLVAHRHFVERRALVDQVG